MSAKVFYFIKFIKKNCNTLITILNKKKNSRTIDRSFIYENFEISLKDF